MAAMSAMEHPAAMSGSTTACAAPQRKLGYAIVGLGYYATQQIMPNFAGCEHAKLVALVSGTPAKLAQYGDQYGIPKAHRYSYAEFDRILKLPDVKDRMFDLGLDPVGGSAESFGTFVKEDIARWAKVIKEANVKAEQ